MRGMMCAAVRRYSTFSLQAPIVKRIAKEKISATPKDPPGQVNGVNNWNQFWSQRLQLAYTNELNEKNTFVILQYAGPESKRKYNTLKAVQALKEQYPSGKLYPTTAFQKNDFNACFQEPVIKAKSDSKHIALLMNLQRSHALKTLLEHITNIMCETKVVGVKINSESSLISLQILKPFLDELSTKYTSYDYESLLKIAKTEQSPRNIHMNKLLNIFGKHGIVHPTIIDDKTVTGSRWLILSK